MYVDVLVTYTPHFGSGQVRSARAATEGRRDAAGGRERAPRTVLGTDGPVKLSSRVSVGSASDETVSDSRERDPLAHGESALGRPQAEVLRGPGREVGSRPRDIYAARCRRSGSGRGHDTAGDGGGDGRERGGRRIAEGRGGRRLAEHGGEARERAQGLEGTDTHLGTGTSKKKEEEFNERSVGSASCPPRRRRTGEGCCIRGPPWRGVVRRRRCFRDTAESVERRVALVQDVCQHLRER